MRLSLVLLALSTLAAAGPLPPFSTAALEARAPPFTPANNTLGSDPVAALTKLKAVYDSVNEPKPSGSSIAKRGFWKWLKDAIESPGLKIRSPVSNSTSYDEALGPDLIATLTDLKAVYDSLDVKRTESGIKAKRDFWKWLKDAFESPGLKIRSPVFNSTSFEEALGPDLAATLTDLKAVYEGLNVKRTEGGFKAKRGFWKWLKETIESPGLEARSYSGCSLIDSNSDDASETERAPMGGAGSKGPIFP